MKVLGIHDGHNASACMIEDGRITAAIEQERIVRVKNWCGVPDQAIRWVLDVTNTKPEEVDWVALNGRHMPRPHNREQVMEEYSNTQSFATSLRRMLKLTPAKAMYLKKRRNERLQGVARAGIDPQKVHFVEHHLAHASAAYFGWGKMDEDVLVLTNDGGGDFLCATVSRGNGGTIKRLAKVPDSESIGNIYAMTTFIMGMVPLEHEFKLMGMAPYAHEKGRDKVYSLLRPLMQFDGNGGLTWHRTDGCPETYYSYRFFSHLFERQRFDSISAGLQQFTEDMLVTWVRNCMRQTGLRKVALSGGTFMNVKANKLIMELPELDDLFIFPSPGDETNAMGAALWTYEQKRKSEPRAEPLGPFYFGPEVDRSDVEAALQKYPGRPWDCVEHSDIEAEVGALLARGEIVARCKGRMEFGARALGNRSILADPTRPEVIRIINDMIKSRDFWMPFAPAILEERSGDYLRNPKKIFAPYMILSFDTTERAPELQAALHPYDRSARPEVVREGWNPDFHRVLKEFERRTGRGVLLNTSFNLHGFPIVMTADDALDVFDRSGLQHLAVGNFMISKTAQ